MVYRSPSDNEGMGHTARAALVQAVGDQALHVNIVHTEICADLDL